MNGVPAASPEQVSQSASVPAVATEVPVDADRPLDIEEAEPELTKRRQTSVRLIVAITDMLVIVTSAWLAYLGRGELGWLQSVGDLNDLLGQALLPMVLLWIGCLFFAGAYSPNYFGAGSAEYKAVLRGSAYAGGLTGLSCYLAQIPLSRGFVFLLFAFGTPALLIARYIVRVLVHRARERGHLLQRVLVAGGPNHIDEIVRILDRDRWQGFDVIGALVPENYDIQTTRSGIPVLGRTSEVARSVVEARPDIILFTGGAVDSARSMRRAVWQLEETRVQILISPSLTDVASDRLRYRPAAGLPLIELETPGPNARSHYLKRAFDVVVASTILVLIMPLLGVLALLIKLEDNGPVIFRQVRVGRKGRTFELLKLRSMVVDAEAKLAEVAQLNHHGEDAVLFKSGVDPRVTRIGRFIRRFSIDEIPQLINVIRGDMSLVGPRPPLPSEVDKYEVDVHRRLQVRPGLTGLWQVSGRSDLSWEDSVRLDLYYVDNWSITQDLIIMLRTVYAVFSSRGAY